MPDYRPQIGGVLINLGVAVCLSALGVLLFALLWLRKDRYKVPQFNSDSFGPEADLPANSLRSYLGALWEALRPEHADKFISRYGFEYFFYLQFHRHIARIFVLCFCLIAATISIYSLWTFGNMNFALNRIVGIYYGGSKAHPLLNTILMTMISGVMTYTLRRFLLWFQAALEERARSSSNNPRDPYFYILNTALLFGAHAHDEDQRLLKGFLANVLKQMNCGMIEIKEMYTPGDRVHLGRVLTDIDETRIFWEYCWFPRVFGKCV